MHNQKHSHFKKRSHKSLGRLSIMLIDNGTPGPLSGHISLALSPSWYLESGEILLGWDGGIRRSTRPLSCLALADLQWTCHSQCSHSLNRTLLYFIFKSITWKMTILLHWNQQLRTTNWEHTQYRRLSIKQIRMKSLWNWWCCPLLAIA